MCDLWLSLSDNKKVSSMFNERESLGIDCLMVATICTNVKEAVNTEIVIHFSIS